MPAQLYIGLMSGTSADGIDAALVEFEGDRLILRETHEAPFTDEVHERILSVLTPGADSLDVVATLDCQLGEAFAAAALALLGKAKIKPEAVSAIGSHGQTIRHRPSGSHPFTSQIGDPNIICERTGITTVADFRRRDIAAGGQGAPLVPAFHQAIFARPSTNIAIINIGGISNITVLGKDSAVIGFDCGPGNGLLDAWTRHCIGHRYDANGRWSATGTLSLSLLKDMLSDPFFHAAPPKSTGKEYFHLNWLRGHHEVAILPAEDVAATLTELTARAIVDAAQLAAYPAAEIFVCGGGARNGFLMSRIRQLSESRVDTTATLGVDPQWVEAMAFAWMARQTMQGLPSSLPSVTGARGPRVLGAVYPRGERSHAAQYPMRPEISGD